MFDLFPSPKLAFVMLRNYWLILLFITDCSVYNFLAFRSFLEAVILLALFACCHFYEHPFIVSLAQPR